MNSCVCSLDHAHGNAFALYSRGEGTSAPPSALCAGIDIFRSLSMAHAVKLIHMPKRLKFETGSCLSRKGEMMPHFIIILSGTAEVREQEFVDDRRARPHRTAPHAPRARAAARALGGRPWRVGTDEGGGYSSLRSRKSQALTVGAYLGVCACVCVRAGVRACTCVFA
jgi:hypothetical protein